MKAGGEREALAELADELCAELGYPATGGVVDQPQPDEPAALVFGGLLSPEQEQLVATARRSLARIAAALGVGRSKAISETTYQALLDGAALVMRNELAAGHPVKDLMPSFVFLISLPLVDQDKALELSRRTSTLLEIDGRLPEG